MIGHFFRTSQGRGEWGCSPKEVGGVFQNGKVFGGKLKEQLAAGPMALQSRQTSTQRALGAVLPSPSSWPPGLAGVINTRPPTLEPKGRAFVQSNLRTPRGAWSQSYHAGVPAVVLPGPFAPACRGSSVCFFSSGSLSLPAALLGVRG